MKHTFDVRYVHKVFLKWVLHIAFVGFESLQFRTMVYLNTWLWQSFFKKVTCHYTLALLTKAIKYGLLYSKVKIYQIFCLRIHSDIFSCITLCLSAIIPTVHRRKLLANLTSCFKSSFSDFENLIFNQIRKCVNLIGSWYGQLFYVQ